MKAKILISKERGITLVALVITIIIMLILAGVTLSIALGENGLFNMARTGANKYEQSAVNEQTDLDKVAGEIANILGLVVDTKEVLNDLKEYQGKYVDLGLDVDGKEGTTNDWEIFYVNEDRIFLIAADYVPADKLEDWQVIGDKGKLTNSGFKRYDSYNITYNVGWSPPLTFLTLPTDPENYLDLVMHTGYTLHSSLDNSTIVSQLLNKDAWSGIKNAVSADKQDCIDFVIGSPTLEMWCAAWNKAVEGDENGFVKIKSEQTNGIGYYVSSDQPDMQNQKYLYMNGTTTKLGDKLTVLGEQYKTFFPHTSEYEYCDGYWLASPSANIQSMIMFVNYHGEVADTYFSMNNSRSVRPIVCLASEVQLTETSKGSNIYNVSMK